MCTQSEQALENELIKKLGTLGYEFVTINDEKALLDNLKSQLEKHNKTSFSKTEFDQILNHLQKGNVFEKAKTLRDKFELRKDNGDVEYIEFMNQEAWCQNQYQVTNQVTIEGTYKNRYDVTLLVNGLPLVQIELKRRGLELKEAFNQINRYQRHSYWTNTGLFNYIQIFVISNGVNTKYYANNRKQSFKQTFYWADEDNETIRQLNDFAESFLEKCKVSKMIARYIVLHESDQILMILRPYQYYAVEKIIEKVKETDKGGYVWHTTGSGKTLTSFKASQILTNMPKVHKVVFVVDRNDLDYQTTREFNHFSNGSVDGTSDTKKLVEQFTNETPLVVTTIQKLNTAISREKYLKQMQDLKDKQMVFIFDECHRSQFGDTHKRITSFFHKLQIFGFTGTPILADNATRNLLGKRTTKDLFGDCLHKYIITNAIRDENVLKFSIEYIGRYKEKLESRNYVDIDVEAIDTKELLESKERISKIADYIIANHDRKTHSKDFTSIFAVSGVETLIKYYEIFKEKKDKGEHDLRIVTIFSYSANEEDKDADGTISDPDFVFSKDTPINVHTREKLDSFIDDYNSMYSTRFSTKDSKSFYNYYKDIAKRIKEREKEKFDDKNRVDILLVVNMYLTGFDAKKVNTLYVDKNLKYHGLIQAFSRTNRIFNDLKSHGNIVCFRNLKKATDQAIALFSNKEARETILVAPYEEYLEQFAEALEHLKKLVPTVSSVDGLVSEEDELAFVKAFRELIRLKNVLAAFADFSLKDLGIPEQEFEDYKSKYLDLYEKTRVVKEKVSILNDVDFELELIQKDEINVAYILKLIASLYDSKTDEERTQNQRKITEIISGDVQLRSKKELIEQFINENLPQVKSSNDIEADFDKFWQVEKLKAFEKICSEENLLIEKAQKVIEDYNFEGKDPLDGSIEEALNEKPKILERQTIIGRVKEKIMDFIRKFDDDIGLD